MKIPHKSPNWIKASNPSLGEQGDEEDPGLWVLHPQETSLPLRWGSTTAPRDPRRDQAWGSWTRDMGQGHREALMGNQKRGSGCVCSYICDNLPPLPGDKKLPFLLLILMSLSLSWHFSLILSLLPFINVWHIYYIKTHSLLNSKVMTFMEH